MTITRETLEIALVAVNRQRAGHRRSIDKLNGRTNATVFARRRHEQDIARLDAAHAELASELDACKAASR